MATKTDLEREVYLLRQQVTALSGMMAEMSRDLRRLLRTPAIQDLLTAKDYTETDPALRTSRPVVVHQAAPPTPPNSRRGNKDVVVE